MNNKVCPETKTFILLLYGLQVQELTTTPLQQTKHMYTKKLTLL